MTDKVVLICGGIGGAKLAKGLYDLLPADSLTIIVNTGDDFRHLGLPICPDLDTVTYSLAGLASPERGWGLADETFGCLSALARFGEDTWFCIGDRDLATHLYRNRLLEDGRNLTEATKSIANALGVQCTVLPVTNDSLQTQVRTNQGVLGFQEYFVHQNCKPEFKGVEYVGSQFARPTRQVVSALMDPELGAVVIAPSNPYLSIGPMLAIPELRKILHDLRCAKIAVSPIVNGASLRGPLSKILVELGIEVSPLAIAGYYEDVVTGFICDSADDRPGRWSNYSGPVVHFAETVMDSEYSKRMLAKEVLSFGHRLRETAIA